MPKNKKKKNNKGNWYKCRSFDDLLKVSKYCLQNGKKTIYSSVSKNTNSILVEECVPYLKDFLTLHDLRVLTTDSQIGIKDKQREYLSCYIEKNTADLLIGKLMNNKDISFTAYNWEKNKWFVNNDPDKVPNRINLTKYNTNAWYDCSGFSELEDILDNIVNGDELVYICFIMNNYGDTGLFKLLIDILSPKKNDDQIKN